MAFDQTTRIRLQRFVNDARRVLEEEFTRQLHNDYGMDPNAGSVTELASLRHINDAQRESARILRDTLAHYCAGGNMAARQGLDRIVREQAFTVLNRLAALRMAEARGLLVESVGNGLQAKGFQLYARLAGTGLGETGDAYRAYLFSVFDELSQDLPGLFDRYSPQGRLFPREAALLQVLNLVNDAEIAPLWSEDETIGWIYQYFNSKEERKAMRDASQAPRNSHELAVRNQFFTPRYVVEFLVDNTLGRLWFNATSGATHLRERCQYLLVKPDETPQAATKLRDPRTLKLLDPACGSMHFGLYAFDLFAEIYRESWAWEQLHGPGSLDVSAQPQAALKPLSQTYADEAAFLCDLPRLIIEHNIYGVDIDPRAAQIASLALWLRAQRAWHDAGVKVKDRPLIGRGHVVAAIAPPAERDLQRHFSAGLDKRDAELFEKTLQLLKGLPELGVLLQVEKDLQRLTKEIYVGNGTGLFAEQEQETWWQAETRLRKALLGFSHAAKSTYQARLFAQDALDGLRLIDLSSERFDVLVMNPPFGEPTRSTKTYLDETLPRSKGNLLTQFIERATQLVRPGGRVGAIVSRTCFFLQSFSAFRKSVLAEDLSLESFVDLGQGVLDAMVETAAVTWERNHGKGDEAIFFRELNRVDKNSGLLESIHLLKSGRGGNNLFMKRVEQFSVFDDMPYVYWISDSIARKIAAHPAVEPLECSIRVGLQTGDDFRFLRLWWEVNSSEVVIPTKKHDVEELRHEAIELSRRKKWVWYSKTESASPVLSSIHLYVNWFEDGAEIKAYHVGNGHSASKYVMSESMYFRPGFSYMLRSSRLVPYLVPLGVIPTAGRSQVYPKEGSEIWLAALLSSNLATAVSRFRGEAFWQPKFQNSMVSAIPYIKPEANDLNEASRIISDVRERMAEKFKRDETEILFTTPSLNGEGERRQLFNRETLIGAMFDGRIAELTGLTRDEFGAVQRDHNEALVRMSDADAADINGDEEQSDESSSDADEVDDETFSRLSWGVGVAFGRFDWRLVTGERQVPLEPAPFDPLPAQSPGMLSDVSESFHVHNGILVDDQGHPHDLVRLVEEVLTRVAVAVPDDVRRWLQREFFPFHLRRYAKSRRKAPIYWPMATPSGSYTLWVYYPSLSSQTLYTAINDFVEPKLKQIGDDVTALRNQGVSRTREDEKQFETLQAFEFELLELRDTLLKLAPTYKPKHDDGVQISAAPLWPLFRHKAWQKVLKDTWAKLEKGDYDWAHLAKNYWPERVREKCKTDKSLAIAHRLENLYVEPVAKPKKARGKKESRG
ncbi:BREX-1 system adenine-specific DNA-methyltransferase PglX [Caballeronia sp. LZ032]|uniref:BREX-1 system adenine-specific DNA-methyltransferase PglX n=1 Tax=Caballeronia sp. LZ032 TaxID=3038565 RepID=UPI0028672B4A|nr:BREX-1 system adenine-specific DNA-methyltransferase PglX [Caballeronia sp. LZ032]MDR5879664.1 BREX-1 system adenine-specific DNA-methyltransferase PglX [Caballeronia sp. LZ032]